MKVNKAQALLYMYSLLIKNHHLTKKEVQSEIAINNLTFSRYIQELRAFLYNFYTGYDLVYVKRDGLYILEENSN